MSTDMSTTTNLPAGALETKPWNWEACHADDQSMMAQPWKDLTIIRQQLILVLPSLSMNK